MEHGTVSFRPIHVKVRLHVCVYLTVSNVWVSECIGSEDPAEGSDAHLILKGGVLRERAVQIPLYLLCCQVVLAH